MDFDFKEMIPLVNRTGLLEIKSEPLQSEGGRWSVYSGVVRVGAVELEFALLYLQAGLSTHEQLSRGLNCLRSMKGASAKQIVYANVLIEDKRFPSVANVEDGIPRLGTKEFFTSFAKQQLSEYLVRIHQLDLKDYVHPDLVRFGASSSEDPESLSKRYIWLRRAKSAFPRLDVLVAEPGQGKTYLSKYIAQGVANMGKIPLLVSSDQWVKMSESDLGSLWKTIVNTFKYFEVPISWVEGAEEEFVRVAQKTGLFTLIFDGFDEYVLRTSGNVNASETLSRFRDLTLTTSSQIVITSRTVFWECEAAELFSTYDSREMTAHAMAIKPFDRKHAQVYFRRKFANEPSYVDRAIGVFDKLKRTGSEGGVDFVGRGVFLYLVADLFRGEYIAEATQRIASTLDRPLEWVSEQLCERESMRQRLGLCAKAQFQLFEELAEAIAVERGASTYTLSLLVQVVGGLDSHQAESLVGIDGTRSGKLAYHPLLRQRPDHKWLFCQDQLFYFFLTRRVLSFINGRRAESLRKFIDSIRDQKHLHFEIGSVLFDTLKMPGGNIGLITDAFGALIEAEREAYKRYESTSKSSIASCLAVLAVNEAYPRGADKLERRQLLQAITGSESLQCLHFSDSLTNFDFRGVTFKKCTFDNLAFIRCVFDKNTRFESCRFVGVTNLKSINLGGATFTEDCFIETDLRRMLAFEAVSAGSRQYMVADLKADVELLISKFLPNDALPPRAVRESSLSGGRIAGSPLHRDVVAALKRFVIEEAPAERGKKWFRLRPEVLPSVRYYKSNGVFTGALADMWATLQDK